MSKEPLRVAGDERVRCPVQEVLVDSHGLLRHGRPLPDCPPSRTSEPLDDRGSPHARRHAERGKPRTLARPLQLVEQCTKNHRAGRAQRMTHRDGPAIHVDLVVVPPSKACMKRSTTEENASFTSKRSISPISMPLSARIFLRGRHRAGQHDRGDRCRSWRVARMRGRGAVRPVLLAEMPLLPIRSAAAPSTMPEELPAWWICSIRSRCGYFISATASKPGICSPMSLNAGLSAPSACMSGAGADVFIPIKDRQAVHVRNRHDGFGKPVFRPGPRGAFSWLSTASASASFAGKPVFGRDDVGRDALRGRNTSSMAMGGIDGDGRPVRSPWRPGPSSPPRRRYRRHPPRRAPGLAARLTASNPLAQKRLMARPGDTLVEVGMPERPSAQGSRPVSPHLRDVAPYHVLDRVPPSRSLRAFSVLSVKAGKPRGGHFVQGAVLAALATGSAYRVVDIGVGHVAGPLAVCVTWPETPAASGHRDASSPVVAAMRESHASMAG